MRLGCLRARSESAPRPAPLPWGGRPARAGAPGPRGPDSRRPDNRLPLETPLPTHALRGSVETQPALPRPCIGDRFSLLLVGEPWPRRFSQTLLLSALYLQRHSEPLRERPVPAAAPTCAALPGMRDAGCGPGMPTRPGLCAPAWLHESAVDAGRSGEQRRTACGRACAASPALGVRGLPGAGRRGVATARGPSSAGGPGDPGPRHLGAERGRV